MKVMCDRAALAEAMSMIGSVVVTRTPTPVLQCVKLTGRDGVLDLAATDLDVSLRLGIDQVEVSDDGEVLVPADKLSQIVRALEDPTVTLEAEGHALHIRGTSSHFKVYGFDPSEAPVVRELDDFEPDCEIGAKRLHQLISRTLFAAAAEQSRYAINGVLFERTGRKLRLVATDGRRLAVARGECSSAGEREEASCIVPTKALNLLSKLIDDPETVIRIGLEENRFLCRVGDGPDAALLTSNLVEGAFPPFEDVIPKDQDKRVKSNAISLSSAIRRAALLTNEESKGVRLTFEDKKLTLNSRAPEMGEAEIELDLDEYEGEPVQIGFNPGFIMDALKVVDGDDVMIELKAPNKPGVIRTGNDFTYVVMPVNLQ